MNEITQDFINLFEYEKNQLRGYLLNKYNCSSQGFYFVFMLKSFFFSIKFNDRLVNSFCEWWEI